MEGGTGYELTDFLLFSKRVYDRLFILLNEDLWPFHVLTLGAALLIAGSVASPSRNRIRASFAVLSLLWFVIGWAFFLDRYATINWAAVYVAPFFFAEGSWLAFLALKRQSFGPDQPPEMRSIVALAAFMIAVLGYPAIEILDGTWRRAEVFGIAPDPTIIGTLALLSITSGKLAIVAWLIPLLWSALTGLTLWTLGSKWFFVTPAFAILLLGAHFMPLRRQPASPD